MTKLAGLGGWPVAATVAAAAALGAAAYFSGMLDGLRPAPDAPAQMATVPPEQATGTGGATAPAKKPADTASAAADAAATDSPVTAETANDTPPAAETAEPAPSDAAPAPAVAGLPSPPTFDLVRVEADGSTLIAGKASPEWSVAVELDGDELVREVAGSDGKFATFLSLPVSDVPRVLTLAMYGPSGQGPVASEDRVILAPRAPVATAGAAPAGEAPAPAGSPPERTADATADAAPEVTSPDVVADARDTTAAAGPAGTTTTPAEASTDAAQPAGTPATGADAAVADAGDAAAAGTGGAAPVVADAVAGMGQPGVDGAGPEVAAGTDPDAETTAPDRMADADDAATADTGSAPEPEVAADTGLAETAPVAATEAPAAPVSGNDTAVEVASAPAAVAEPLPPTVILSRADETRVLQAPDAPPTVMSEVSLDAITYTDTGEVELAGRGVPGAFVRVYLDNKPIVDSRIAEDGTWRTELPNVDKGVYTLRVDQVDDEGTVRARVETPFEREADADVRAALKAQMRNGVLQVTVQPGFTLWAIARENLGSGVQYVKVYEANADRIRNPDLIYPGQIFTVPEAETKIE